MTNQGLPQSATIAEVRPTSVGIRELRDHLSAYLERVKAGEPITITEHGKPIARIIRQTVSPRMQELLDAGVLTLPSRPYRAGEITAVPLEGSTDDLIDWVRGAGGE